MSSVTLSFNHNLVSLGEKMTQSVKVAQTAPNMPRIYKGDQVLSEISQEYRQRIIEKLDKYSDELKAKVRFDYDPNARQMVAKIVDADGNVREQVPTKEMIDFSQKAREFISKLLGKI